MFTAGQMADIGTERIAEDGIAGTKDAAMGALSNVRAQGIFKKAAVPYFLHIDTIPLSKFTFYGDCYRLSLGYNH